jgi:imidazolonepropionase
MKSSRKLKIFNNIGELLTLSGASKKDGRNVKESDLGIINKAAIVTCDDEIIWCGSRNKIPKEFLKIKSEVDLQGLTVLPGFIECHTHSVFAGNRANEFELRNQGSTYQEIASRGGGILSTMNATRKISSSELKKISQRRVNEFVRQGVTTLEIKSGYALDEKNELKCLQVAKSLTGPRIITTFLGAHALPPEFKDHAEYLEFLSTKLLPIIKKKKLANRADIYIEKGFFTKNQALVYLQKAKALGFELTIHADQFSLSGGADLSVELSANSADHLIHISNSQTERLAKSNVTCVLLPAADLYLKCPYPPARKLIDVGARVALATDFNPGSSPTQDLALVGLLARLEMKMTLPEVICAYTFGAASALGLQRKTGSIEEKKSADFIGIELPWNEVFYSSGLNPVKKIYKSGVKLR